MIQIQLNALEHGIACLMATMRQGVNDACGVIDQRVSKQPGVEAHLLGIKAELAFARAQNIYPDFSFKPRSGGAEFNLNGCTIDVKATERRFGGLISPPDQLGKATHYVLATVDGSKVSLIGWATEAQLLGTKPIKLYSGGPPTHFIAQENLIPLEALHEIR